MASNPGNHRSGGAAAIVAALLLPPLGVFLVAGLGRDFWMTAGLTCVGFVPGAMFALFTVMRGAPRFARA